MTATTTAMPVRTDGLHQVLPQDGLAGTLVGRVWRAGMPAGPAVVVVRPDGVFDLSKHFATMSTLLETDQPAQAVRSVAGEFLCSVDALLDNSKAEGQDPAVPWLLAPCDLQVVKAAGVTFAGSMIERVIEEQAGGDASRALGLRSQITALIGTSLSDIRPGSAQALALKNLLQQKKLWSQYLEVGIGPDADLQVLRPQLLLLQQVLQRQRLGRAGADVGQAGADQRRDLAAQPQRTTGVAAGLLLDHAFDHAAGKGHAGGLDNLQVAGRQQPRNGGVLTFRLAVVEQRIDAAQELAGHRTHGLRRLVGLQQRTHGGEVLAQIEHAIGADHHHSRAGGHAGTPDATHERSGQAVLRQHLVQAIGAHWHGRRCCSHSDFLGAWSMVVVRRALDDAAVLHSHVQRGAVHQLPGVAAVHFLSWGIGWAAPAARESRAGGGRSLRRTPTRRNGRPWVDANHVTDVQPAQATANCTRRGRPMRPAVQSPDPMI